jgi:beta-carotene 3-hydroxylase
MDWITLLLCALITIGTFLFWEFVAWFTHKYIMHGVHDEALERNDLFALVFSVPSIFLFYYFSLVNYNAYMLAVALGIFFYGMFYLVFHDIIVHQRIRWRPEKKSRYLQRMINAHYVHHSKHTKEGCEAFGFLYAPRKYEPKKFSFRKDRQETQ